MTESEQHLIKTYPGTEYHYFMLIPHAYEPKLLVMLDDSGQWTLPHLESHEADFTRVAHINEAISESPGLNVVTLRCFANHFHDEMRTLSRFYAMDNLDPQWEAPEGTIWLPQSRVESFSLAHPEHRNIIHDWFEWEATESPGRTNWSKRGWYQSAAWWISDQLDRLQYKPVGQLIQHRTWSRSCILSVETDDGSIYLKDVTSAFAHEPVITRIIAQRHPGYAPDIMVVDVENSWMLMRALDGEHLTHSHNVKHWENALEKFACIQIDMIPHAHTLISLGCPDRNVDHLAAQVDYLLADIPKSLTPVEADMLHQLAVPLRNMCYDLIDCGVPLTLGHGDFCPENIMVNGDHIRYFDWSDVSISHPLFDLSTFLSHLPPDLRPERDRLRDAYLKPWTQFIPMEKLREAYKFAEPLALLHRVMVYKNVVLRSLDTRSHWEIAPHIPDLLRRMIVMMTARIKQNS